MRPPVRAIEPCSRGVLIRTRGCSAMACSRVSALAAASTPGGAAAPVVAVDVAAVDVAAVDVAVPEAVVWAGVGVACGTVGWIRSKTN